MSGKKVFISSNHTPSYFVYPPVGGCLIFVYKSAITMEDFPIKKEQGMHKKQIYICLLRYPAPNLLWIRFWRTYGLSLFFDLLHISKDR